MSEHDFSAIRNYCANCGAKLKGTDDHCPSCGKTIGTAQYEGIPQIGAAGKGYSEFTEHPSFAAYGKFQKKMMMIFIPIIAVVVAVILMIMGTGPALSIFVGVFLFVLMLIIAMVTTRKKPSWQGTVVKKTYSHIKKKGADRHVYTIKFETDDGKTRKQVWQSHSPVYDYLQEGDAVRFLGNLGTPNAYEKYDKSSDDAITCVCCGHLMDPRFTYCTMCGAILLKGAVPQ